MIVYVLVCYMHTDSMICGVYRYKEKALYYKDIMERKDTKHYSYGIETYEVIL